MPAPADAPEPPAPPPGFMFEAPMPPGAHHFVFDFGRARLGVSVTSMTEPLRRHFGGRGDVGILVQGVETGTAADKAGVQVGDMIIAVDGDAVTGVGDVARTLADRKGGEAFTVEVVRARKTRKLKAEMHDDPATPWPPGGLDLRELPGGVHVFGDDAVRDEQIGDRLQALERRLDELERQLSAPATPRARPGRPPTPRRAPKRAPGDHT